MSIFKNKILKTSTSKVKYIQTTAKSVMSNINDPALTIEKLKTRLKFSKSNPYSKVKRLKKCWYPRNGLVFMYSIDNGVWAF